VLVSPRANSHIEGPGIPPARKGVLGIGVFPRGSFSLLPYGLPSQPLSLPKVTREAPATPVVLENDDTLRMDSANWDLSWRGDQSAKVLLVRPDCRLQRLVRLGPVIRCGFQQ
jgi:hypothetical protein